MSARIIKAATAFSGIGAPEHARPDWQWLWHAEIDAFASAVMAARHPGSTNLGDVTAFDFIERARAFGPLDVLIGGPPCQAFSVAGLRRSLGDERGNLTLQWVRIIHAVRPIWALTENVPGWLSTDDNAFGCFLGGLVGADAALCSPLERGRWPDVGMVAGPLARACWRVLDAQYTGVPQRRRRVFVVASLGERADPAAILFEPQSVCGDFAPRREPGQRVAPTVEARADAGGAAWGTDFLSDGGLACAEDTGAFNNTGQGWWNDAEAAQSVRAADGGGARESTLVVSDDSPQLAFGGGNTSGDLEVTTALRAKGGTGHGDFESETFIVESSTEFVPDLADPLTANEAKTYTHEGVTFRTRNVVAFEPNQVTRPGNRSRADDVAGSMSAARPHAVALDAPPVAFSCKDYGADTGETAPTLRGMEFDGSHANGGGQIAVAFQTRIARNGRGQLEEISPSLNGAEAGATSDMRPCVAMFKPSHFTRAKDGAPDDRAPPLSADADKGDQDPVLMDGAAVRRLTPVECERLMDFEDGYTLIVWRGKPAADGNRYRVLGNSMVVSELRWLLARVEEAPA